jgi:hypothetical protein
MPVRRVDEEDIKMLKPLPIGKEYYYKEWMVII